MHLALKMEEARKKSKERGGKSEKVKYLLKYEVKYVAQYSCLENLTDRVAWWTDSRGFTKSPDTETELLKAHTQVLPVFYSLETLSVLCNSLSLFYFFFSL